ncbi:alpha/beta hydrolase [Gracilinema caldarium]|uniref:alpha/beta hydrolase n=1 Tax=Gracilinema caldarium TaxID=215591 RepID=UPI0026E98BE6|nr:alpha/beta hydrolase-fold protein [Gracilinema caldarium]
MKELSQLFISLVIASLVLSACQSQDPFVSASRSLVVPEAAQPRSGVYALGYTRVDEDAPPKAVVDYLAAGEALIRFPYHADGKLTFAVKVENAITVSLWMSAQQGDEPDQMKRYPGTDWYWITYTVPSAATLQYHYNVKTAQDERLTLRDPLNRAVSATAPYESLWSAELDKGASRFEYLEVPYEIPGREKPAGYAPPVLRKVLVYLPPAYDMSRGEAYSVLYMQDGQNAWDSSTANYGGWKTDRVLKDLIGSGRVHPAIVVSIFNSSYRSEEYAGAGFAAAGRPGGARAAEIAAYYRDWVIMVLKPLIDTTYRTLRDRDHTGVIGSSYGGTVAIYWSLSRPNVFGLAAALSYAPGDEQNLDGGMTSLCRDQYLPAIAAQKIAYPRIWLDCGQSGIDKTLAPFVSALDGVLRDAHYEAGPDYHFELFPGADHNEAAWYRRLPAILEFLLHL